MREVLMKIKEDFNKRTEFGEENIYESLCREEYEFWSGYVDGVATARAVVEKYLENE